MLERLLFKKISLWIVALLAVISLVIMIFFGASVRYFYTSKTSHFQALEPVVKYVASIPFGLYQLWNTGFDQGISVEQRFKGQNGFTFNYDFAHS